MMRLVSKLIFQMLGWSVIGHTKYPRKSLVIAAPHTSNWDFFYGRCYAYIVGFSPKYLIKSELFLPILGKLIKINGGIPVYRDSNNNLVEQISKKINSSKELIIGMSPEGTRKRVDKWKTGFYYISLKSSIPILLLKLDYSNREIGIIQEFYPTGNFDEDMKYIESKYKSSFAKKPMNYNPKIF